MKKILEYLPLHFVVCLILGIVFQFYTDLWSFGFLKIGIVLALITLILLVFSYKVARTVTTFFLFFCLGVAVVYINTAKHYKNYYQKHLHTKAPVVLKINKVLKPSNYHYKYEVSVTQVGTIKTRGKVLLNVSKDSVLDQLKVDELIYTTSSFSEIKKALHPHQFDYQLYLKKKDIHQQIILNSKEYAKLGIRNSSLQGLSAKFRNKVQESLKKYHFKADEMAVINALILGQRQEISKDLISNYAKAGAIHILAVSGLHVGILLWILTWLLNPLERLKRGKIIKTITLVVLLWMFAFVAGLSASVVRAVTMFTFLVVGLSFKRKNVVLFSLISSMFFLLVFKPMFLFDVGFQLSYLAVFGIIFIQPKLFAIYKPRLFIDRKVWEIITVSMSAQIGVLPLSLYYFHQFPGLFMLSNLIIIPFLSTILALGILVIVLSFFGVLPQVLASFYGNIIGLLNSFIYWISKQEAFLFQEISFSLWMLLFTYAIIVCSFRFLMKKTSYNFTYVLTTIIVFQSVCLLESHQKHKKKEFIVFHKSRNSMFGKRNGVHFTVHHDLDSLSIQNSKTIKSYEVGEGIIANYQKDIPNVFSFKNQLFLVVDSLGVYQLQSQYHPIVLLQQSPKINLERLIKTLQPKQIIVDGSNYKSYVERWQKIAQKLKTPFHYTGRNGAFKY